MKRKTALILAIGIFILSIAIVMLDTYVYKSEDFGLAFGVAAILLTIVIPVGVIVSLSLGSAKIVGDLASSKVSASEKEGMLRRIVIVIVVAAAAIGIFGILNALGTALIDI